ncbi:MAG: PCRF domain-containing protein, partial [Pseudonocardiales bacterium]|nr:PCRF domain-containing protein [Pseudonocardiales bacterium]
MNEDLAELEQQAADPELWSDQERAQQVTSRMSHIRADLERVAALRRRLEDLGVMFELAADEHDADTLAEAEADLAVFS